MFFNEFIDDIDDDYIAYNRFNKKIYTQDDILVLWDEIPSLISMMENKPEEFIDLKELSKEDQNIILDNIKVISEDDSIKDLDNNLLRLTFLDYNQLFLEEHYVLLVLNSSKARRNFYFLMFDLFVFVMLIITGLIFFNVNVDPTITLFVNQLIVSIFIASVIDILKNIFQAVQFEFKAYGIRES